MMHPEITMAIARQRSAERIRATRSGSRAGLGRSRPVKAVRRAFGR